MGLLTSVVFLQVLKRLEEVHDELEQCGEDMDRMSSLLDEMERLNSSKIDLNMDVLDRNIDKMMPELGFGPEDNDNLVASYRYVASNIKSEVL